MFRPARLWLLLVALLAATLIFAACGDDDGDDDGDGDEPDATEVVDGDGDDDGDDDGDGVSGLQGLADELGTSEIKIEYEFTSGTDGETEEGSFTLYWKPEVGWRVDFEVGEGVGTFLSVGENAYICSEEENGGTCLESPLGDILPVPFLNLFTDPDEASTFIDSSFLGVDVSESEREIAGIDAKCFSVDGDVAGVATVGEVCFGAGTLLLVSSETDVGGLVTTFSFEAISVEDSVSDADLEPPYPVEEIDIPDFDLDDFDLDDLDLDDFDLDDFDLEDFE